MHRRFWLITVIVVSLAATMGSLDPESAPAPTPPEAPRLSGVRTLVRTWDEIPDDREGIMLDEEETRPRNDAGAIVVTVGCEERVRYIPSRGTCILHAIWYVKGAIAHQTPQMQNIPFPCPLIDIPPPGQVDSRIRFYWIAGGNRMISARVETVDWLKPEVKRWSEPLASISGRSASGRP